MSCARGGMEGRGLLTCVVMSMQKRRPFLWKALVAQIPEEAGWGPGVHGCHPLPVAGDRQAQNSGRAWFKTLKTKLDNCSNGAV